jgi:hypothetical protein
MTRKALITKAIRRRFAVTLKGNEGVFSGVLTEHDRDVLVFEQCQTVPGNEGGTPNPIKGRVFVERSSIAYLQEI